MKTILSGWAEDTRRDAVSDVDSEDVDGFTTTDSLANDVLLAYQDELTGEPVET